MKILIGSEVESDIYDFFRMARNNVLDEFENMKLEINEVEEISFCIYLLKNFKTTPKNRYNKKFKRIELEVVLEYELFVKSNEMQKVEIIMEKIKETINNYSNKSIGTSSLDKIKEKINKILKKDGSK
jgi:hypothetical protein